MGACASSPRDLTADEAALVGAHKTDPDFSFAGQRFLARVIDVYDGDTVRVAFRWSGRTIVWRARMAGYDSPEMKPPLADPNRDAIKADAYRARDALRARLASEAFVWIRCGPFEKYGRLLVTMYARSEVPELDGPCINAWMLNQGYGYPYDGGRKAAATKHAHTNTPVTRTD